MALTEAEREAAAKQAEGYPPGNGYKWGIYLDTQLGARLGSPRYPELLRGEPGMYG